MTNTDRSILSWQGYAKNWPQGAKLLSILSWIRENFNSHSVWMWVPLSKQRLSCWLASCRTGCDSGGATKSYYWLHNGHRSLGTSLSERGYNRSEAVAIPWSPKTNPNSKPIYLTRLCSIDYKLYYHLSCYLLVHYVRKMIGPGLLAMNLYLIYL